MKTKKILVSNHLLSRCRAALLAVGATSAAHAQVTVDGAWARATVPNQSATGAFMRLTAQKDVVLTGAQFPDRRHRRSARDVMDKGVMRMRPADRVPLKAGQTIELKSGGLHIITGPEKADQGGGSVPMTLSFTADGSVSMVEVKATAGFTPPAR